VRRGAQGFQVPANDPKESVAELPQELPRPLRSKAEADGRLTVYLKEDPQAGLKDPSCPQQHQLLGSFNVYLDEISPLDHLVQPHYGYLLPLARRSQPVAARVGLVVEDP
jgi:hypothetical protein